MPATPSAPARRGRPRSETIPGELEKWAAALIAHREYRVTIKALALTLEVAPRTVQRRLRDARRHHESASN
jgi:hypothetical protein